MTLREIIENHLKDNEYDGLCGDECGCEIGELFPCEDPDMDVCKPGYKTVCPGEDKCPIGQGCTIPHKGNMCMTTKKDKDNG